MENWKIDITPKEDQIGFRSRRIQKVWRKSFNVPTRTACHHVFLPFSRFKTAVCWGTSKSLMIQFIMILLNILFYLNRKYTLITVTCCHLRELLFISYICIYIILCFQSTLQSALSITRDRTHDLPIYFYISFLLLLIKLTFYYLINV